MPLDNSADNNDSKSGAEEEEVQEEKGTIHQSTENKENESSSDNDK